MERTEGHRAGTGSEPGRNRVGIVSADTIAPAEELKNPRNLRKIPGV